jgi:TFIIF-interacting CTD phosphatase-like protein
MNSNTNVLSENKFINDISIKNKGFLLLAELFRDHGWNICKNEMNWICFTKFGHETEFFEIHIDLSKIHVSIPIKNSPYQYNTSFQNYFEASEYIEERFKDFILEY